MKKRLMLGVLCTSVLLAPVVAQAEESGKPAFAVQYMMLDTDFADVGFEPSAIQLKLINPISPNVDVEGVLGLGAGDDSITVFNPFFGNVSLGVELSNMFGIYVRAHSGADEQVQVYGHIGLVKLDYDITGSIGSLSGTDSASDTGIGIGFGVNIAVSDNAGIILEYNQFPDVSYDLGLDLETTSLSLGFQMEF